VNSRIPADGSSSPGERIATALVTLRALSDRLAASRGADPTTSDDLALAIEILESVADGFRREGEEADDVEADRGRYMKLFDLAPGGYLETDLHSVIKLANVASAAMLGLDQGDLLGTPLNRYISEESRDRFGVRLASLREGDEAAEWEVRMYASDGAPLDVSVAVARGRDGWEGTEQRRVLRWLLHDITERKKREDRVAYLASHDELTGLPNRRMLGEFLRLALARARRNQTGVAVLCIDIDDFKAINDNLGHDAGDTLLHEFGKRLDGARREADVVARFGGDEFMMLLADLELPEGVAGRAVPLEAELAADRIQRMVGQPFLVKGIEVHTSMSTGISVYPIDAQEGPELLARADAAMYRSKAQGRRRALLALDPHQRELVSRRPQTEDRSAPALPARALRTEAPA
jgi:diguanylate cyclase (GGDEF)-like protein/PAS domain S-box-containing protein